MKAFALILVLSAHLAALAQPITLRPGSNVVINGDIVSCEAEAGAQLPACSIRQNSSAYILYAGDVVMQTFYNFDQAIEGAKKARAAGLCR